MIPKLNIALVLCLIIGPTTAATLSDINVTNSGSKSTVTLGFDSAPIYTFFSLHNPERVVVDIFKSNLVNGLPCNFSGKNLIKRIRTSTPLDKQSLRLVFELTHKSLTQAMTQHAYGRYNVFMTMTRQQTLASRSMSIAVPSPISPLKNLLANQVTIAKNSASALATRKQISESIEPIVIAIDAGHGGQDPGATGSKGLHEKNVTIAIARKLKTLLDVDPMFQAVLIRDGDYFISVKGRADIARKKGASVLVSIHADAAPNRSVHGSSVWVLSNQRAKSEMANWLEQHEKQSELLGGGGDLLTNTQADPYLKQVVLDLQFGYSQRVSYDIAVKILHQLQNVGTLHKRLPEHSSLGVLRSPDIPSLLVETGFISNIREEQLLGSNAYQKKIAKALHLGLRAYFLAHPLQTGQKLKKWQQKINLPEALTTKSI